MRRLLLVLLLVAAATVTVRGQVPCRIVEMQPACEVVLLPGPTEDTLQIVMIEGTRTYPSAGQLRLTTVAVDADPGFRDWLRARFSATAETVAREALFPPGETTDQVNRDNAASMAQSQTTATVAGLIAAGYRRDELVDGARIVAVTDPHADEASQLHAGDVMVSVDGEATLNADDATAAVARRRPGDRITLGLKDGRELTLTALASPQDPSRPLLGLLLTDELNPPFDVTIEAGNIGGPSAGMMFALGIVDLLGADDLTGGATVAGTGTITADGTVGPIGGIQQKILGATSPTEGEPATVFLVPTGDMAAAVAASVRHEVMLVPVATLDDAVAALRVLARGGRPAGAVDIGA